MGAGTAGLISSCAGSHHRRAGSCGCGCAQDRLLRRHRCCPALPGSLDPGLDGKQNSSRRKSLKDILRVVYADIRRLDMEVVETCRRPWVEKAAQVSSQMYCVGI